MLCEKLQLSPFIQVPVFANLKQSPTFTPRLAATAALTWRWSESTAGGRRLFPPRAFGRGRPSNDGFSGSYSSVAPPGGPSNGLRRPMFIIGGRIIMGFLALHCAQAHENQPAESDKAFRWPRNHNHWRSMQPYAAVSRTDRELAYPI